MHRMQTVAKFVFASLIAAGLGVQSPQAEEKKEEYVSTAEVKTLLQKPLPGVTGKAITILDATVPPNWVGGRHYHSGPVYVVVKEGAFRIDQDGKPPQIIESGEAFEEPIGTSMQAMNPSASKASRFLLIQVNDEGEPLMYKSD